MGLCCRPFACMAFCGSKMMLARTLHDTQAVGNGVAQRAVVFWFTHNDCFLGRNTCGVVVQIIVQLARKLQVMHMVGWCHRDIKVLRFAMHT